jgi:hypothetical protein
MAESVLADDLAFDPDALKSCLNAFFSGCQGLKNFPFQPN